MKSINNMNLGELAAFIDTHLREKGINVVLSGGASVAIYSDHKYVSKDLDFIGRYSIDHKKVESAMLEIGFERQGRYYHHPKTSYFAEFISGPPTVGQDPISEVREVELETGIVRIISPTDSVKDRLAAFYHWGDKQSLEQALLISRSNDIDIKNVELWSIREGKKNEFGEYKRRLKTDA
ncbi:MAG: hypothetical protein DRJ13_05240 [Bacteroidetes bacterium]|nr:MAG: hypothetical protein DRJ13_05240 [Bacteroidota bacterium]